MAYTPQKPAVWAGVGTDFSARALLSNFDLPPHEEMKAISESEDRRLWFATWMKVYGFARGVTTLKTGHAQVNRRRENIKFSAIVSGGGIGQSLTVRCDPAFMYNPTLTNGGAAVYSSPARQWDIIRVGGKNVRVKEKLTVGAQHTYVLEPYDGTFDIASIITAGSLATTEYAITTNEHPEGSNVQGGRLPRMRKYQNTLMIIKEAIKWTGTEATILPYHTNEKGEAGPVSKIWLKPMQMENFQWDRSNALLSMERSTNTQMTFQNPQLGYDVPLTGTEGFLPFAEKEGYEDITNFSTFSITDLRNVGQIAINSRAAATKDYMYVYSWNVGDAIASNILDKYQNTADRYLEMIYTTLKGGDKMNHTSAPGFALTLGLRSVQIESGFNFTFKSLHEFDDDKGLGLEDKYKKYAIAFPMGYLADNNDGDSMMPMIGYNYRKLGKYSRETITDSWGGFMSEASQLGDNRASGDWDVSNLGIGCEIGFHGYCGNAIIIQREV